MGHVQEASPVFLLSNVVSDTKDPFERKLLSLALRKEEGGKFEGARLIGFEYFREMRVLGRICFGCLRAVVHVCEVWRKKAETVVSW